MSFYRVPADSPGEACLYFILSELKLGKQATGYKTAQKILNRFS
ncbi:hypothetical protein [Nostoc sp. CCY 9925]